MAQYESGTRTPKADLTNKLAEVFGISPDALSVPDIDSYIGLMHTLFTLEDIYGLTIEKRDGEIIMRVDPFNSREAQNLLDELHVWCAEREKYRNGEISKDDYDKWRYNYPKYTNVNYAKAPSQELNEAMARLTENLIALYFYNNSNNVAILLPTRATARQKPLIYALFDGLGIIPTRWLRKAWE